jgi:hypothetical protein
VAGVASDWRRRTTEGAMIGPHIIDVWLRLGGGELHGKRGRAFWRDGDGWSVSLDLERGLWYDHALGGGGGVIELVQVARNCDRRDALVWLEEEGFIERRTFSREERREYARRRDLVAWTAREIPYWRAAIVEELNARKMSAAEIGDFEELECAARLCHLLENGSPESVAWEFIKQRRADPAGTTILIEREMESRRILAAIVLMIVSAMGSGERDVA